MLCLNSLESSAEATIIDPYGILTDFAQYGTGTPIHPERGDGEPVTENLSAHGQVPGVADELRRWRNASSIRHVKSKISNGAKDAYSIASLASGGMLDILAAIRAGFHPIWGSEIDPRMQKMWVDLTHSSSLGDMLRIQPEDVRRPVVIISGTPCVSFSSLGHKTGAKDPRGDLYIRQGHLITAIQPEAAILEQSANALEVNDGAEVKALCTILSDKYYVHSATVPVWQFGDATNRIRLFIVAIHKKHGDRAAQYQFPTGTFNDVRYPTAADIAVPDNDVPQEYKLQGKPVTMHEQKEPTPGTMHTIGRFGHGAGDRHNPHNLHSWYGLANTQLTSNGGGRRPMLTWRPGDEIHVTRLTTPAETVAMASLPHSYLGWVRTFDKSDDFVRLCVNNGVPQRTSYAISQSIHTLLQELGVPFDVPAPSLTGRACHVADWEDMTPSQDGWRHPQIPCIKSQMLDTGANLSCSYVRHAKHLSDVTPSKIRLGVADSSTCMRGETDGTANILVINTECRPGFQAATPYSYRTTTMPGIRTELLSLDTAFRDEGYSILLRQGDYEDGSSELYKPACDGEDEVRIPIRYDHHHSGSWWIDYVFEDEQNDAAGYMEDIHARMRDNQDHMRAKWSRQAAINNSHTCFYAAAMASQMMLHKDVAATSIANGNDKTAETEPQVCINENTDGGEEITYLAAHADDKEIKGTKQGLKHGVAKMNHQRFHASRGHLGYCENCDICIAAKGTMRRITKKKDPYRETRPGYLWAMDAVTFSHRSMDSRSKWMITLRCICTGVIHLLYLHRKSDATREIEQWITRMRADPYHQRMGYDIVQTIHTDNAGEWQMNNAAFQQMAQRMKIRVIYTTPETSKELGAAERTNGIVEVIIKAILLEENLPPDHWEVAARGAEFLLNRFPNTATDSTAPIDGDRERPLEKLTRGAYSRRQIDRELTYYVQPGRVALVHQPVKGSTLQPKCRWAIGWGMTRECPEWRCPYTGYSFRSKSFTAFELNRRMNYIQFLGLPEKKTMGSNIQLPMDKFERIDVHLPAPRPATAGAQLPIIKIKTANDHEVKEAEMTMSQTAVQDRAPATGAKRTIITNQDGSKLAREAQPELLATLNEQAGTTDAGDTSHHSEENVGAPSVPPMRRMDSAATAADESQRSTVIHSGSGGVQGPWVKAPHPRDKSFGVQSRIRTHNFECENECGFDAATEAEVIAHEATCIHTTPEPVTMHGTATTNHGAGEKLTTSGSDNSEIGAMPLPQDMSEFDMAYVDLAEIEDVEMQHAIETTLAEKGAHKTQINESFDTICRKVHKIPFEFIDIYHRWLLLLTSNDGTRRFQDADLPRGRQSVKPNMKIPPPYGPLWQQVLDERGLKWKMKHQAYEAVQLQQAAMETSVATYQLRRKLAKALAENMPEEQHMTEDDMQLPDTAKEALRTRAMAIRKKRAAKHDGSGTKPPTSIKKAVNLENIDVAQKWVESIEKEWQGLNNITRDDPSTGKGVFEHNLTRNMLFERGIDKTPIPLSVGLTYKFNAKGEVARYKTRMAVAGHSGHMKKGIDYDKTYASTPTHHSCRILQATMVKYNMVRKAYDIAQAYTHAGLPSEQQVPIRYPDGYKRYCPETGAEMYMLLVMNLYGLPQGGRLWEHTRNKVIMEMLNKDGYTCNRSRKEPCLFIITKGEQRCYMIIHTDDVDTIGTTAKLLDDIHTRLGQHWECKEIDPGYMLGLQRSITHSEGHMEVEITMTAFVESMMNEFLQYKTEKAVHTPMTPGVFLHKQVKTIKGQCNAMEKDESKAMIEKGYQSLLGSLLWAARGVFPECMCGASMLGRVLAMPSQQAFNEAVVMLNYMYQNRNRGIKFQGNGNGTPVAFADASNKPDPTDSKCQYGSIHMFQGGPIIFASKKLTHVGLSALHNEYMGLSWCNRQTAWLRELLVEMGMADIVSQPTITYCDNTAAIMLAEEDVVSTGNQFITTPYHYNKEMEETKQVKTIYVRTADNIADLFTKAVSRPVIQALLSKALGYAPPHWIQDMDRSGATHKQKNWPTTKDGKTS